MREETIDGLKQVRELLSDPQRWTKGYPARDANMTHLMLVHGA